MDIILLGIAAVAVLFCGIVLFGAPFVPTKKAQIEAALDLLDLKPGQILYDLGAGDGRVAIAAARRGVKVIGYELNLVLVAIAFFRTKKFRHLISIHWGNYWRADFSKANGIFIFSAEAFMKRLDKKIIKSGASLKLTSFAFQIPGKSPVKEKKGVYLYEYPIAEKGAKR